MVDPIIALDSDKVSKLTGIPKQTLSHWEKSGIFKASYVDPSPRTPYRRIYSFRDVVSLRALAQIRRDAKVPFKDILAASQYLSQYYESPWSELRFGLVGGKLVFWSPEEQRWLGAQGQAVLELNLDGIPDEIRRELPSISVRDSTDIGEITQHRYVLHNKPVIAGTRIPVSSIWSFHEAGYTPEQIVEEYPQLRTEDVVAAVEYEQNMRRQSA